MAVTAERVVSRLPIGDGISGGCPPGPWERDLISEREEALLNQRVGENIPLHQFPDDLSRFCLPPTNLFSNDSKLADTIVGAPAPHERDWAELDGESQENREKTLATWLAYSKEVA